MRRWEREGKRENVKYREQERMKENECERERKSVKVGEENLKKEKEKGVLWKREDFWERERI